MVMIAGLTGAIRQLAKDPTKVDQVITKLTREAQTLEAQGKAVIRPADGWYGGSGTGGSLARHSVMAHEAVAEEFRALAEALTEYRDSIRLWDREVDQAEDNARVTALARERVLQEVETRVTETGQSSADDSYGDGRHEGTGGSEGAAPSESGSDGTDAGEGTGR